MENSAKIVIKTNVVDFVYYHVADDGIWFRIMPSNWENPNWYGLFAANDEMISDFNSFMDTSRTIIKNYGCGWSACDKAPKIKIELRCAYKDFNDDVIGALIDNSELLDIEDDEIIDKVFLSCEDIIRVIYLWSGVKKFGLLDMIEEQARDIVE